MDELMTSGIMQYVVFALGKEEYGIDIQKVTTIEKMLSIARVPKTANYIKGVINLRGEVIPIMDLRTRFKMPYLEETEDTRIIIFKIDDIAVGMIVDAVAEVVNLPENQIEDINSFSDDMTMDYLNGVGKIDGRIVTLLNLEKLIKINE